MADRDVEEVRLALVLEAQQAGEHVVGDVLAGLQRRLARVDLPVEPDPPLRRVPERPLARLDEVVDVDEELPEDVARPRRERRRIGPRRAEVRVDRAHERRIGELRDDVDLVAGDRDELARVAEHRVAEQRHVLAAHRAVHRRVVVVIERRVVDAEDERARDGLHLRPVQAGGEARRVAEHLLDVLRQRDDGDVLRRHDRLVLAHERKQAGRGLVRDAAGEARDLLGELVGRVLEALADLVVEAHARQPAVPSASAASAVMPGT